MLDATPVVVAAGAVLLMPSLVWPFALFHREEPVPPITAMFPS